MALTATFTLHSAAIKENQDIPRQYSCKGANQSPELKWSGAPHRAKSFALIVSDPDAPSGTFIHWVIWNIPAKWEGLPAGLSKEALLENGVSQGVNSFGKVGYDGPCPPPGKKHRYIFTLYALDSTLELKPKATADELRAQMKGHLVSETKIQGLFGL